MIIIKNTTISIDKNIYIKLKQHISSKIGLSVKEFTEKAILKLIEEEIKLDNSDINSK